MRRLRSAARKLGYAKAVASPGPHKALFEAEIGRYFNRKYVFALNSGTSANEAAVYGLGLRPGDEVLCPAAAPIFVALPVLAAGVIPVFVDGDPRTLIPGADDIEERITERTKAVVVVHLWGQPAPLKEIFDVAERFKLKVVEDCAQAYDSYYEGRRVGSFGDVMCSSLQASKHITCGEGGFVATDDPEIHQRSVLYSNAGMPWYASGLNRPQPDSFDGFQTRGHFSYGHNHRMSVHQAAIARYELRRIGRSCAKRRRRTAMIEEMLEGCAGVHTAHRYPGTQVNYWEYPVRVNPEALPSTAAEVCRRIREEFPQAAVLPHNEISYLERVFQEMQRSRLTPAGYRISDSVDYKPGLCPKVERAARHHLRILIHHTLPEKQIRKTVRTLRTVVERLGSKA